MTAPAKPLKIAFILPLLGAGGAERVLITLMNRLDRARFAPEFIVLDEDGPMRDWIADDIPFHSLGHLRVRQSLPRLLKEIKKLNPDIVVATQAHMNFALLLLRPFLRRQKLIVREANVPSSIVENVRTGKPWMVRGAYKGLYPLADLVISPAQIIIDEFASYLNMKTDNHALLYNPVDEARIRGDEKPAPAGPGREGRTHFICAGRLHRQKGFDRLIAALPSLGRDDCSLTILGAGTEESALKHQVVALGLENRVHLPGLSSDPWPHIAAADCFLLPSRWEGLPNVVLESLSVGTPVIASKEAGGIGEIAALAAPGAVTVADGMAAFLEAMRTVKPAPAAAMRGSLLPETFRLETVMERFEGLLERTYTIS